MRQKSAKKKAWLNSYQDLWREAPVCSQVSLAEAAFSLPVFQFKFPSSIALAK